MLTLDLSRPQTKRRHEATLYVLGTCEPGVLSRGGARPALCTVYIFNRSDAETHKGDTKSRTSLVCSL